MLFKALGKPLKLAAMPLVLVLLFGLSASAEIQEVGACSGQSLTLPFADVPGGSLFFCAIAGAYFSGLINGSSSAFNPSGVVTRDQMAAFVLRTQDSAVRRASRKASAGQWAVPRDKTLLKKVSLSGGGGLPRSGRRAIWLPSRLLTWAVRESASAQPATGSTSGS